MDREPLHRLLISLRTLSAPAQAGLSDAQLLDRFVTSRDEAAFELLLWRHGPTVLGVCRRLLNDPNDADDAFQATFLALARKAGSIARREVVGTWLHRVAYRVALRVRAQRARQAGSELADLDLLPAPAEGDPSWREFREVLDEEVERLPARHRAAFVLCCLEGKTGAEAAQELGCPVGTVSSRLTRARERLRRRLIRRGLGPTAVAVALGRDVLIPSFPAGLVPPTLQAALVFSSGKAGGALSARSVAHAEGVLRAMFLTRLKIAALLLVLAGLLTAGGVAIRPAPAAAPPQVHGEDSPKATVVSVVKPQRGGLQRKVDRGCMFEAFERADVHPGVSGVLKDVKVDIGDQVKKGQVLAEVDAPLLALAVKQAAVGVQQGRGLVREAQARIRTASAEVTAARSAVAAREIEVKGAKSKLDTHESAYNRLRKLYQSGAVTESLMIEKEGTVGIARSAVSAATAAVTTAKADLDVKQGKLAQAEAGLDTAKANMEAAEIELEKARHSLAQTKVLAPFDGVITQRNYGSGQSLSPGATASQPPLLTVQRIDRMRVVVDVPELDAPDVVTGSPAELSMVLGLNDPGLTNLSVSRVGFALDRKNRTMRVEIDVPNPNHLLRPGMLGRVNILLKKPAANALRLPLSSLVALSRVKWAVYVVRDSKAHRTPIQTGRSNDKEIEVLSGLKATDLVVTNPKGLREEVVPVEVKE
jgi:RND family efflux transporter MFP subunit